MHKYCGRVRSHQVWIRLEKFYHQLGQLISQWLVKNAQQIEEMNAETINRAIWQVIWRSIINGMMLVILISLIVYSGYLKYQFPDPQHLDLFLLIGTVLCNILLTQLLNLKYFKTVVLFLLCLGSLVVMAHLVPLAYQILMYLYTSWLLIFILPVFYGLTVAAFDLPRFRNILIALAGIVSTSAYILYLSLIHI
jgi:hypothetical protein